MYKHLDVMPDNMLSTLGIAKSPKFFLDVSSDEYSIRPNLLKKGAEIYTTKLVLLDI